MLKQPQEPNEEGSVTRHPNGRTGGRFVRFVAVPGVVLGVIAAVVLVFAGPAMAWNVGSPKAESSCPSGTAVINGTLTNNEPAGNDMSVTMTSQFGSDGPKTVPANGQPVSFTINTGQQSLSAGDVTFNLAWANGNPGTDQVTAHYEAVNCGPPDDTDKKIGFCHATGSTTNPYVFIETSVDAFYQAGHIDHVNDIWPAFSYTKNGQTYNVPAQGDQSLLNYRNPDCVKPQEKTPVTPSLVATPASCDNQDRTVSDTSNPLGLVVWNPSLPQVVHPGETKTFTATPAADAVFTQGAQTTFTISNDLNVENCNHNPPSAGDYNGTTSGTCKTGTGTGYVDKGYGSSVAFTLKVGRGKGKWAVAHFTVQPGQNGSRSLPGHPGDKVLLFAKGKVISASTLKKNCGTPPPPPPTCQHHCTPPPNNPPTTPPASCTSASCVPTATAETGLGDMIGSATQPHRGAGWMDAAMLLMTTMVGLLGLLIVRRRSARLGLLRRQ